MSVLMSFSSLQEFLLHQMAVEKFLLYNLTSCILDLVSENYKFKFF
jgi:hypothetical protein